MQKNNNIPITNDETENIFRDFLTLGLTLKEAKRL